MKESDSCQSSPIIEIAPNGDIIFAVGPEMARIHVNSQLLKTASKHFFVMLGKEAHNMLFKYGPVELPLPEDNAAALKIIFAIIHKQSYLVPRFLTPNEILEVAIAVEKYDLVNIMQLWSGIWRQPGLLFVEDLIVLAAAAYLFQNAQGFKGITKALILKHKGSYLSLLSDKVESTLTWKVYWKNSEALSG
ncbi:hypothetical protein EYC80_003433 [Monilinia laxa]|uniref:BTB domain-containing protein n=1 Tax=Monilinia laxa TaxID=61186 RepID=A0A5N6KE00_MONLA|nr:hypothetical protein EYC80_003433 [Monilinia laxa]